MEVIYGILKDVLDILSSAEQRGGKSKYMNDVIHEPSIRRTRNKKEIMTMNSREGAAEGGM